MKYFNVLIVIVLLINIEVFSQCPNLPDEFPTDQQNLDIVNLEIAKCFAPTIRHIAELDEDNSAGGRADLITAVNYDGDWDATNNWENLANYISGNPNTHDELDPKVYYSVVWTDVAWVITYGFYHPRDWSLDTGACCSSEGIISGDNHENDFEGTILVVSRIDKSPGITKNQVIGGFTISHHDLLRYTSINVVPGVFIDNRTHAVELNLDLNACIESDGDINCDNCISYNTDHIVYTLNTDDNPFVNADTSVNHGDFLTGTGEYELDNIFGNNSESLWAKKDEALVFNGDKFASSGNSDCTQYGGDASAPWGWEQLKYSNAEVKELICQSFFDVQYSTTCIMATEPLIIHNPYVEPECSLLFSNSIVIDSYVEYNSYYAAFEGITIMPGGSLSIKNSTLKFTESGFIDVRVGGQLIIDNSTLTNCSGTNWQGIRAFADNLLSSNGVLEIKNSSKIENAIIGLSLGNQWTYNTVSAIIENTNFEGNLTGIIIPFGKTDATINSCYFQNETNIELNASYGLRIENSEFNDFDPSTLTNGIIAINSSFTYEENNLMRNQILGIAANGTFPLAGGMLIGSESTNANHFRNNHFSIWGSGVDRPLGIAMENNLFYGTTSEGIYTVGVNKLSAVNNSFDGVYNNGVYSANLGDEFNTINCNEFNNSFQNSIYYYGNNSNSVFLGNQFIAPITGNDVAVDSHHLSNFIGLLENPAENCFSSNSNDIIEILAGIDNFSYFYYDPGPDCQEPDNTSAFNKLASSEFPDNCTSIGIFGFIDPDGDGYLGIHPDTIYDPNDACIKCIKDSINLWITHVIFSGGDDPTTVPFDGDPVPTENIFINERILDQWINFGLFVALETDNFSLAEEILTPLLKWRWQSKFFGVKMLKRDYTDASQFLNGMSENNLNEIYFKDIQELNLILYTDPGHGEANITEADLDHLKMIATSNYPVKGYALSLYYQLTGVHLILEQTNINPRNSKSDLKKENLSTNFNVFPNPAGLLLRFDNALFNLKEIFIYDIQGNLVKTLNVYERNSIDISDLSSGLYFLLGVDKESNKFPTKFMKN
ncbi:MAG: T9SS type A sorting domain-containing protein [Saprospiraceae bacterium]|nr:T9SS type A sorting domain-containing protein [Saprospiraceae bacterium]